MQRHPPKILHGQVGDAALLADLVDGDDVVVLERAMARASRRNRRTTWGMPASSGLMTFKATERSKSRVFRLEDQAHAALADATADAVMGQPTELTRGPRRVEEIAALRSACESPSGSCW